MSDVPSNPKSNSFSYDSTEAQAVRDLLWAINSAALVKMTGEFNLPLPTLREDQIDAEHLAETVKSKADHRVGRYFETLIGFYLQHVRGFELVARSKQVFRNDQTLGELDFVFRNRSGELQHWETAVKFYLHRQQTHASGSHLIGPNPADNFENKIHRLTTHQLPMSAQDYPDVDCRRALLRGRIFYHIDSPHAEMTSLPTLLAPDHLKGLWCHAAEWPAVLEAYSSGEFRFCVATKPHWLSSVVATCHDPNNLTRAEIDCQASLHFQQSSRPLLVCILKSHGDRWEEIRRIFLVSRLWPERHQ